MNTKLEKFIVAYNSADEEIKKLIDSDKIGLFCEEIVKKNPTELVDYKSILIVNTANRLLEVINKSELELEIKALNLKSSGDLVEQIESFVLTNNKSGVQTSGAKDLESLKSEISDIESGFNKTSHIRTMAQDMDTNKPEDEVVYTSTQAAILNEVKPKPESSTSWGAETK